MSFSKLDLQALYSETTCLNLFINCVHYQISKQRSEGTGQSFDFGIVSQVYNFTSIQKHPLNNIYKKPVNKIKSWVKTRLKNYRFTFIRWKINKNRKKNLKKLDAWCYNIKKGFQTNYIFNIENNIKYIDDSLNSCVHNALQKPSPQNELIRSHLKAFVKNVKSTFDLDLSDQTLQNTVKIFYDRIIFNRVLIECLTNKFNENSRIYIGSSAKPMSKVVSFACQNAGGRSTSFSHGNEIGLHVDFSFERPTSEFGCYTEFVFSSQSVTKKCEELIGQRRLPTYSKPKLVTSFVPTYRDLVHSLKVDNSKRIATNGKTVMLLGFPMGPHRYWHFNNAFFYDALRLEIDVCNELTNAGFDVIYKAHPDRLGYVEKIMNNYASKVITDRFEDIVDLADILIFHYTHTSTFGYALCSDKPIVLCSSEIENIQTEDFEALSSRVTLIDYMGVGATCAQRKSLIAAVSHPMKVFSHKYILQLLE